MKSPFPGMDPYLEHPALWPDVHNRLIAAISDAVAPSIAPRYYVGLERRAFLLTPDDVVFIGRPDIAIVPRRPSLDPYETPISSGGTSTAVLDVGLPTDDQEEQSYLEVREVKTGLLVTVLEILSPVNKLHIDGRRQYEEKRNLILRSRTNLIEIDLLRAGEPMTMVGGPEPGGYRILVSRGWKRPRAKLYAFDVRAPIPTFPLPLLPEDGEPDVDLNAIFHGVYERARFDLRLDYQVPPVPPLSEPDAEWSRGLIAD